MVTCSEIQKIVNYFKPRKVAVIVVPIYKKRGNNVAANIILSVHYILLANYCVCQTKYNSLSTILLEWLRSEQIFAKEKGGFKTNCFFFDRSFIWEYGRKLHGQSRICLCAVFINFRVILNSISRAMLWDKLINSIRNQCVLLFLFTVRFINLKGSCVPKILFIPQDYLTEAITRVSQIGLYLGPINIELSGCLPLLISLLAHMPPYADDVVLLSQVSSGLLG